MLTPPVATFDYSNACQNDSTYFTDHSFTPDGGAVIAWLWDFGDGSPNSTSTLQNPQHGYADVGDYDVKLVVTNQGGCQDSIVRTVTVGPLPVANFNFQVDACGDGMVYFSDSSYGHLTSIQEWYWEFEPGYFSTERNPWHDYAFTDTCYAVTLTVTDGRGCQQSFTDTVCIAAGLEFGFTASQACIGELTHF